MDRATGSAIITQTLSSWPDKQDRDLGWAYVALEGTNGSEGVTVVITDAGAGGLQIRSVEWGRP